MNINRKLSIILIISLALIGTSYATWTDKINIKNTVSTGKLEVSVIDAIQHRSYDTGFLGKNKSNENMMNISKQYNANNIDVVFNVDNMFPGSYFSYDVLIKNTGTIPVKIEDIEIINTNNLEDGILENIVVDCKIIHKISKTKYPLNEEFLIKNTKLSEFEYKLNSMLKDKIIGLDLYIILDNLKLKLLISADNNTENIDLDIAIKFNFKQFNK